MNKLLEILTRVEQAEAEGRALIQEGRAQEKWPLCDRLEQALDELLKMKAETVQKLEELRQLEEELRQLEELR